ncbi:RNA polymerase factor sigma-54 [Beijerinckia sp. L45]|uniref:RNA polymerase factor sigma-54 n=1 Tax=Beijerinckia sp. L45 TaxID=1641855 RepID=UPI00131B692E|nr:RNA polymerase factor sigma-54 [Beijerinckia sp. L45]
MALTTKLLMRQGQSLVMTPQLLQAIKLLQFSNIELASFVQDELERNPLLERADEAGPINEPASSAMDSDARADADSSLSENFNDAVEADWSSESFATDQSSLEASLGTELNNSFDSDRAATPAEQHDPFSEAGLSASSWSGSNGPGHDGEASNLESYIAARMTLKEHLAAQLPLAVSGAPDRLIGHALIDAIDDSGYLSESLADIADRLGSPIRHVTEILMAIQTFDPVGVGARNLAECLTLQLRDRNRFDPAMQALVGHLEMVARRDMAGLRKVCGVDDEDIADMIAEIKRLDPKPGRAFGSNAIQPVVPDVHVRLAQDGSWMIELNTEVLPRLLVNQTYAARISRNKGNEADRSFVSGCLQTANWLTKSLEQRARTILKVSSEIVRQQDAFFAYGVEHLRPLNLKAIAEATGMHESTVSRVTSNKYMSSPRGLFELKYFFTASIASNNGGDSHSAESVRFRIRQMIERESVGDVLSDDAIVERLKSSNIDIARRTVAKYRESMRIPSSVERRRQKAVH